MNAMHHPILVVEDDEDIRESLLDLLQDHGYDAIGARDGRDALNTLSHASPLPCLIVLDLMMPVMDGKAFREEQLKDPALSKIPVLVISAYHDAELRCKSLATNMSMRKPLDLDRFLHLVQEYC
jgi:CheY-like chemotaxis protein